MPVLLAGCAARIGTPSVCVPAGEIASYVPMWTDGCSLFVDVGLNGREEKLVLDTGATWTTITETTEREIEADPIRIFQVIHGGGKSMMAGLARVSRLSLAGAVMGDAVVYVAGATPWLPATFRGSLGNELLQNWDVDLDLPDGLLAFEHPQTCRPPQASWSGDAVAVTMDRSKGEIAFPVSVDGMQRPAILDSGATVTTLTRGTRVGPAVQPGSIAEYGYEAAFRARPLRVDHLVLGGYDFGDLAAVQTDGSKEPELLIGLDFLARHRVLISYRTQMFFVEPDDRSARPATHNLFTCAAQ